MRNNTPTNHRLIPLRPAEWGPRKHDSTDACNPDVLACVIDLVVARAGRPDDN